MVNSVAVTVGTKNVFVPQGGRRTAGWRGQGPWVLWSDDLGAAFVEAAALFPASAVGESMCWGRGRAHAR
ncbi:MAG: hypothetical protein M3415_02540 [Actinomycetota bacterium]|jgi:hypothetical protein|nr:hypothetical protein [Actinomycetota bacterium]